MPMKSIAVDCKVVVSHQQVGLPHLPPKCVQTCRFIKMKPIPSVSTPPFYNKFTSSRWLLFPAFLTRVREEGNTPCYTQKVCRWILNRVKIQSRSTLTNLRITNWLYLTNTICSWSADTNLTVSPFFVHVTIQSTVLLVMVLVLVQD